MPDLQMALGVDRSELGLTLIGAAIGALTALTFASPIIERLGARTTAFITVLGTSALLATVPWLSSAPLVFLILILEGLLAGSLEINLNVEIDRIEAQLGRGVMNRAHGFWSLGFFLTALAASAITAGRRADAYPPRRDIRLCADCRHLDHLGHAQRAGKGDCTSMRRKAPLIALPTGSLLPLCGIGIAAFLIEGAGIDWSAIYMRDVFASEPFIGGLGLTAFTFFMAAARLLVDPQVDRFGARAVATRASVACCHRRARRLGRAPSLCRPARLRPDGRRLQRRLSAGGLGGGATHRPANAYVNVAAVVQMSFVVFFLAPPLLGFIADHAGMRIAYLICLPLIIYALFSIKSLPGRKSVDSPASAGAEGEHEKAQLLV
jgi:hypothetical protein